MGYSVPFAWRQVNGFKRTDLGHNPITYQVTNGYTWADPERRHATTKLNFDRMSKLYADFTTAGYNYEALKRLIKLCKARGVRLVIINMPLLLKEEYLVDTSYAPMIPSRSRQIVELSDQTLYELTRTTQTTLFDFRNDGQFEIKDFADPLHLMSHGAVKLTRAISNRLLRQDSILAHGATEN